jgi:hypothetical protein
MSTDLVTTRRCQHVKVNGIQCGSPALRERHYCYFHMRWHKKGLNEYLKKEEIIILPILEDANSIQMGLAEVMRQLVEKVIDHRTAALLFYGLQIASSNVRATSFEPEQRSEITIDTAEDRRRALHAPASIQSRPNQDQADPSQPETKALTSGLTSPNPAPPRTGVRQ